MPDDARRLVQQAIENFPFDDYGLDDTDPNSEYAEWVPALATAIVETLGEIPPASATRAAVVGEAVAALQRMREDGETDMRQAIAIIEGLAQDGNQAECV